MFNLFSKIVNKLKGGIAMSEKYKNDIVEDSYYLIYLFKKDKKEVTQLHVQKLMYLFEAYYMNKESVNKLYEPEYRAWAFGPVAIPLYQRYQRYGKNNIELSDDELEKGKSIPSERGTLMEEIYETFKDFSAMELVNFTHANGSPWDKAWNQEKYSIIPKKEIKEWFGQFIE